MFERMSKQFGDMSHQFDRSDLTGVASAVAVDVADEDDEFVVVADLPGVEKEDIDLTITERVLTIEATHETDEQHGSEEYIRRERRHESVRRTVRLPEDIVADEASASYNNGVLTVTLPKVTTDGDDSHRIDVE
ncbi:HSP20 family protein [Halopelagius inordinatus]|uniref:HSP20 family protein n=2 Tax=Halopelagius inordinatus TaxID=553467 RepID=A0A1I2M4H2_9EURY|nr:HSP20 family protein [Halopelagius inordinatus]